MLSPRLLRLYAENGLCAAVKTTDLNPTADFKTMAHDLENWAKEAGIESRLCRTTDAV
jgi:hypothetical protein